MKSTTGKESFTHRLGDMIERVGEKIANMGNKKIGKKIYDVGNKIEHTEDRKGK